MANDLINHALYNEASIKSQKNRILRAPGLVNTGRFGESGVPGEGVDILHRFHVSCPKHLLQALPGLYPFIINE